jgi:hypothetical protein
MTSKSVFGLAGAIAAATLMVAVVILLPFASATVTTTASSRSNLNASSIAGGDVIWFSSVIQWVGNSPTSNTNVHFLHQTLNFTEPNGTTFSKSVWSAVALFSTTATTAATTWGSGSYSWSTFAPAQYKGDVFLSGYAYHVPAGGLPGGLKVTWSGTFQTSESCFDFNWKWAAAVYTTFPSTNVHPSLDASLGVKPVDDTHLSAYQNSDHAGTPENETAYLAQGGTGGGGSNFTGSYSGTVGVNTCK